MLNCSIENEVTGFVLPLIIILGLPRAHFAYKTYKFGDSIAFNISQQSHLSTICLENQKCRCAREYGRQLDEQHWRSKPVNKILINESSLCGRKYANLSFIHSFTDMHCLSKKFDQQKSFLEQRSSLADWGGKVLWPPSPCPLDLPLIWL